MPVCSPVPVCGLTPVVLLCKPVPVCSLAVAVCNPVPVCVLVRACSLAVAVPVCIPARLCVPVAVDMAVSRRRGAGGRLGSRSCPPPWIKLQAGLRPVLRGSPAWRGGGMGGMAGGRWGRWPPAGVVTWGWVPTLQPLHIAASSLTSEDGV